MVVIVTETKISPFKDISSVVSWAEMAGFEYTVMDDTVMVKVQEVNKNILYRMYTVG